MNISRKQYLEETGFLLNDVIKTNVLTHAKALAHQNNDTFKKIIEKAYDFAEQDLKAANRIGDLAGTKLAQGITQAPKKFAKIWEKAAQQDWLKTCFSLSSGGLGYPEVIGSAISEIFFMENAAFALYYMMSVESAKIIDGYGSKKLKQEYGKKLLSGEWMGSCALIGETELTATPQKDHHTISGTVRGVMGGDHDLVDNIILILPAKIKLGDQHTNGLFIIPKISGSNGASCNNAIKTIKKHYNLGIKGISINDFEMGLEGTCIGFLLKPYSDQEPIAQNQIFDILLKSGFLSTAKMANILELSKSEIQSLHVESHIANLVDDFSSAHFNIAIKAHFAGLRGALLSASFSNDCYLYGGKSQKDHFFNLFSLYAQVLKVYSNIKAVQYYQKGLGLIGLNGYVNEFTFEQNFRDLLAGAFIGEINANLTQKFINNIRSKDNKLIQSLVDEFKHIDPHTVKSDAMRMTIGIWQEYLGGLIVLRDDCVNDENGKSWQLFAEHFLIFLGDLIVCYHLILQGLEAEKKMNEMGVTFFNLDSELVKDTELKRLYDKILMAFHFAKTELTQQESRISVMQERIYTTID